MRSMIQRSLLRQSRLLSITSQSIPSVSPKRNRISPLCTCLLQEEIRARYYSSTETPRDDGANSGSAALDSSQPEVEDNSQMKKDLELRSREIIDLKVGCSKLRTLPSYLYSQSYAIDI